MFLYYVFLTNMVRNTNLFCNFAFGKSVRRFPGAGLLASGLSMTSLHSERFWNGQTNAPQNNDHPPKKQGPSNPKPTTTPPKTNDHQTPNQQPPTTKPTTIKPQTNDHPPQNQQPSNPKPTTTHHKTNNHQTTNQQPSNHKDND